jgi:hypothetical protein
MAQFRDIDLPSGVPLRINGGDLQVPSNNLVVGGGILTLNNASTNRIIFTGNTADFGAPNADLSGDGTKIHIRNTGAYGIGVEAFSIWYSTATNHKWYTQNGTNSATPSNVMTLDGVGSLTISGNMIIGNSVQAVTSPAFLKFQRWSNGVSGSAQIIGAWQSSNYWAIGTPNNSANSSMQIGIADSTGVWKTTTPLSLQIAGNLTVTGNITEGSTLLSIKYAPQARLVSAGAGLLGGGDLSDDRTLSVNFSGNGSGNTVAYANHNHDDKYPKAPDSYISGNGIYVLDTRGTNEPGTARPAGLYADFKQNSINGLSDGGTYNGVLTFRFYGWNTDMSGGTPVQLGFTENNNVWLRKGTSGGAAWGSWLKLYHTGNDSTLIKSSSSGQSVSGNFTIAGDGNLWVGTSASDGADGDIVVRDGSGNSVIHFDGGSVGPTDSNVKAYIAGSGYASFGTVDINTLNVTASGMVSNLNANYINGITEAKLAKNESVYEIGGKGVYTGLSVSQQTVPNMTVAVVAGTVYTDSGRRFKLNAQSVALATSSATFGRYDVVYVQGSSAGNNEGVITVLTGTPSSTPVVPTIPSDGVALAKIFVGQNVGSILNANITDLRTSKPLLYNANLYASAPLYIESTINSNQASIPIIKPIKGSTWVAEAFIPVGSTSYVWNHNLNLGTNYVITLSCSSPNRHIYWTNKTSTSITINIDDVADVPVTWNGIIVGW